MNELFRANQQIEELKSHAQTLISNLASKDTHMGQELARIDELTQKNSSLMIRVQELEDMRRKLHNSVQEARGKMRVLARVRPPLAHDQVWMEMLISNGMEMLISNGMEMLISD